MCSYSYCVSITKVLYTSSLSTNTFYCYRCTYVVFNIITKRFSLCGCTWIRYVHVGVRVSGTNNRSVNSVSAVLVGAGLLAHPVGAEGRRE